MILKQSHPSFHTNPEMKHMAGLFSSEVKGPELRAEEGSVANSCASRLVREQWEMPEGASLFGVTVLSFEKALRDHAETNYFPEKRIVILFSFLLFTEI